MAESAQVAGPSQQAASSQSALSGTPRSAKSHGGTFAQTKLRGPIADEMASEILECPIDDFLGHYAPFKLSDQSVAAAHDELKNSLLKKVGKKKVWTLAPYAKPPRDHDGHDEPIVFGHLKNIIAALEKVGCADVTGAGRSRLFGYKDSPSTSMASEIQGTNFKVDACITSDPKATTTVLSDVVAIAEYKKKNNPNTIEDNRLKLVSAAAQIMNDDPGRMWVYGITIEDTQMAVWYFCRSHSVKSTSFDFTADIETFIRVFLSLLCATRVEIGYDPTVHRVEHDNKICYIYQVGPRYYRTIDEPLFTARVLCITGRKTRVWRVVEVKGPDKGQFAEEIGEHVVLKDGWLDEGASSEQENQEAIFKRLKNVQPRDYDWATAFLRARLVEAFENEAYKDYFMEILTSTRIRKTKARLQSAIPIPKKVLFPQPTPTSSRRNTVDGSTQTKDHSGLPASVNSDQREEDTSHREYKTKEQHRLIYRHVGCALSSAEDLLTSFRAIHNTFIALALLYLARWTHRDISAGNIIVIGKGDAARGKLSDLEYAKEFNDTRSSPDPKTGTPFFMPHEIHSSVSLVPIQVKIHPVQQVDPFASYRIQENPPLEEQATHLVKFLFHHDLESLWWVTLWIILYRVGGTKALKLVKMIFTYHRTPSPERTLFFLNRKPKLQDYLDDDLKYLASYFVEIQNTLLSLDSSEEMTGNPFTDDYGRNYDQVWAYLTHICSYAGGLEGVTFQDPDLEPTDSDSEAEVTEKGKRRKQNTKDDHAYRPNRQGSTRGKVVSTGAVNGPRRSVRVLRRQVG